MIIDELNTAGGVIDALGGTQAVAALTHSRWPSAVSNWRRNNAFPPKTYVAIKAALKARDIDAPNALWGMP